MSRTASVIYIARTITTGGREKGVSRSSDGVLDIRLSTPGSARIGTNPEQLFAAAWSASFESALTVAACRRKVAAPRDVSIEATIELKSSDDGSGFLSVRLGVSLPRLSPDVAQGLIAEAQEICPYAKATKGNIAVSTILL